MHIIFKYKILGERKERKKEHAHNCAEQIHVFGLKKHGGWERERRELSGEEFAMPGAAVGKLEWAMPREHKDILTVCGADDIKDIHF